MSYNIKERLRAYWQTQVVQPVRQLTAVQVFVAVAGGCYGGIFPVPLVTTLATLAICKILFFNAPQVALALVANLCVTPLQFLLISYFAVAAAVFTGADTSNFTLTYLKTAYSESVWTLFQACASMLIHGTLAWLVIAIPVILILNYLNTRRDVDFIKDDSSQEIAEDSF